MKNFILLFLLQANNEFSDSVQFINYQKFINNAELLLYRNEKKASLESYKKAFNIRQPNLKDYINGIIVSSVCKNEELTYNWLESAFSYGLSLRIALSTNKLRSFIGKRNIINIYNLSNRTSFDNNLKQTIDSLIYIDQSNRSKRVQLDRSIDQKNAEKLKEIILNCGFPTENKIGYYPLLHILFLHNVTYWLSDENISIIKRELYFGHILPENYAQLEDRKKLYSTNYRERVYYLPYSFLGLNSRRKNFSTIPIDQSINLNLISDIDSMREKIGMHSVHNSQLINSKKFTRKYRLIISGSL